MGKKRNRAAVAASGNSNSNDRSNTTSSSSSRKKRKKSDSSSALLSDKNPTNPLNKKNKKTTKKDEAVSRDPRKEAQEEAVATEATTSVTTTNAWSKSKKKRMRLLKAKAAHQQQQQQQQQQQPKDTPKSNKRKRAANVADDDAADDDSNNPTNEETTTTTTKKSESRLQKAFKARLSGSRFRLLNEELYTTASTEAYARFQAHPELYQQYHEGFRHQVEQWPVNPVDTLVEKLIALARTGQQQQQNKKNTFKKLVVADFGCGDADLAKQLLKVKLPQQKAAKDTSNDDHDQDCCPFQVHSFDLVASCPLVTACDMAHVPLPNQSVDVGIFCLSLMGTNLADFIREAHRVLKDHTGRLHIAEVRSRFEGGAGTTSQATAATSKSSKSKSSSKKKDDELDTFLEVLDQLGFECLKRDRSNKMFLLLELRKNGKTPNTNLAFTAKPCIYKRR